jgi:co-chaperonin GroES (HSP10)
MISEEKLASINPMKGWILIKVIMKKTTLSGLHIPDSALESSKERKENTKVYLEKVSNIQDDSGQKYADLNPYLGCELFMDSAPMLFVDKIETDDYIIEYGLTRQSNIVAILK